MQNGWEGMAQEYLANAKTWLIKNQHLTVEVEDLVAQRSKLEAQTDAEYLAEQNS